MTPETIFLIIVLIYSVVLHEVAHGYMAHVLGDPTARLMGRLTLNPIKHLDPFGSVILPVLLALTGSSFLFGWAKPVPYNPYNLKKGGRWAEAMVSGAGPATNLFLALVFGLVIRIGELLGMPSYVAELSFLIILINLMLCLFNLIPIPPLDGSKILSALLPPSLARPWEDVRAQMEFNPLLGFGAVVLFAMIAGPLVAQFVFTIARFIAGL